MIRRPPRSTLNVYRRQRQMCIRDSCKRPPVAFAVLDALAWRQGEFYDVHHIRSVGVQHGDHIGDARVVVKNVALFDIASG